MESAGSVLENMNKIKLLFQEALSSYSWNGKEIEFKSNNDLLGSSFCSVAYEAVAMNFAQKDIESGNELLSEWKAYMHTFEDKYAAQIHVGLGWALAPQNVSSFDVFFKNVSPSYIPFVVDGIGYYDGIARQRRCIKNKMMNENLNSIYYEYYNQGVGRSIWYHSGGEISKAVEIIFQFPSERQVGLWRGVGTAFLFVGGFDDEMMTALLNFSGKNKLQFLTGVVLAIKSRCRMGLITKEAEKISKLWFNSRPLYLSDDVTMLKKEHQNNYDLFLTAVEKQLSDKIVV